MVSGGEGEEAATTRKEGTRSEMEAKPDPEETLVERKNKRNHKPGKK